MTELPSGLFIGLWAAVGIPCHVLSAVHGTFPDGLILILVHTMVTDLGGQQYPAGKGGLPNSGTH